MPLAALGRRARACGAGLPDAGRCASSCRLPAGGPADVYARFIGQRLQAALGQPFVVDNKPGAGAITGTQEAAQAAPDGYTLLMMSNTHTVNETLIAEPALPADARLRAGGAGQLLRSRAGGATLACRSNNVAELLALARSKPGQLNYASSGPGTPYHMAGELFKSMAGIDVVHVPYKGSSGARTDVLAGHVQMMFDAVTAMAPQVRIGQGEGAGHHRPHALVDPARGADGGRSRACRATRR